MKKSLPLQSRYCRRALLPAKHCGGSDHEWLVSSNLLRSPPTRPCVPGGRAPAPWPSGCRGSRTAPPSSWRWCSPAPGSAATGSGRRACSGHWLAGLSTPPITTPPHRSVTRHYNWLLPVALQRCPSAVWWLLCCCGGRTPGTPWESWSTLERERGGRGESMCLLYQIGCLGQSHVG